MGVSLQGSGRLSRSSDSPASARQLVAHSPSAPRTHPHSIRAPPSPSLQTTNPPLSSVLVSPNQIRQSQERARLSPLRRIRQGQLYAVSDGTGNRCRQEAPIARSDQRRHIRRRWAAESAASPIWRACGPHGAGSRDLWSAASGRHEPLVEKCRNGPPYCSTTDPDPVPPELDPLTLPEPLPEDDPEVENEDDPLDLLPDDPLLEEPLVDPDVEPDPDPDPEPEPEADPDDEALEPLWAVAGMSLWTQTPSARSVFVPGMWMATVRVGASIRTTESTSSSFMCSSIRKSPGWMNSADAKPHSSPRRIMNGCSGVAFRRRLMTMKPWCSPRRMLATRAATGFAPCRP